MHFKVAVMEQVIQSRVSGYYRIEQLVALYNKPLITHSLFSMIATRATTLWLNDQLACFFSVRTYVCQGITFCSSIHHSFSEWCHSIGSGLLYNRVTILLLHVVKINFSVLYNTNLRDT